MSLLIAVETSPSYPNLTFSRVRSVAFRALRDCRYPSLSAIFSRRPTCLHISVLLSLRLKVPTLVLGPLTYRISIEILFLRVETVILAKISMPERVLSLLLIS